jgi:hypothetical protein
MPGDRDRGRVSIRAGEPFDGAADPSEARSLVLGHDIGLADDGHTEWSGRRRAEEAVGRRGWREAGRQRVSRLDADRRQAGDDQRGEYRRRDPHRADHRTGQRPGHGAIAAY